MNAKQQILSEYELDLTKTRAEVIAIYEGENPEDSLVFNLYSQDIDLDTIVFNCYTNKNKDGSKYGVIISDIHLPANIWEAAYLTGDEIIVDDAIAYYGINA